MTIRDAMPNHNLIAEKAARLVVARPAPGPADDPTSTLAGIGRVPFA
jgi:hypothetical protein